MLTVLALTLILNTEPTPTATPAPSFNAQPLHVDAPTANAPEPVTPAQPQPQITTAPVTTKPFYGAPLPYTPPIYHGAPLPYTPPVVVVSTLSTKWVERHGY